MTWIFAGWMISRLFFLDMDLTTDSATRGPRRGTKGQVMDGAGGQPPTVMDGAGGQPPKVMDGAGGQPPTRL